MCYVLEVGATLPLSVCWAVHWPQPVVSQYQHAHQMMRLSVESSHPVNGHCNKGLLYCNVLHMHIIYRIWGTVYIDMSCYKSSHCGDISTRSSVKELYNKRDIIVNLVFSNFDIFTQGPCSLNYKIVIFIPDVLELVVRLATDLSTLPSPSPSVV